MNAETSIEALGDAHEHSVEDVPQYLTFAVGDATYGIPITAVSEIIGAQQSTRVPDARPFMRGVINLRGTVIPVMDVRTRLGLEPAHVTRRSCIVVVEMDSVVVGLLVDAISEVIDVLPTAIEAVPRREDRAGVRSESVITGLVQTTSDVKILIDVEELLHGLTETLSSGCEASPVNETRTRTS